LTVHEGATIYARGAAGSDVPAHARFAGAPAFDAGEWLRAITTFRKLPEMLKTLRELLKRVDQLEKR
jgi:UDP-3-O-[3-hydroxymyristoyl] glucosamine N-acyltransferase